MERGLLLGSRERPHGAWTLLAAKDEAQLLRWAKPVRVIGTERGAGLRLGQRAKQVATEVAILTTRLSDSATRHGNPSGFDRDDDRGHQTKQPPRPQVGFPQMPKKTISDFKSACTTG